MGVLMLLAPFLHCFAVFFFSATTVRDYLSLAANEIPKEYGKREGKKAWSELGWPNRLRLLYLRLIHCLTTGLVPWVLRLDEASYAIHFTSCLGIGMLKEEPSNMQRKTSTWRVGIR